jgi:hypothetical protein
VNCRNLYISFYGVLSGRVAADRVADDRRVQRQVPKLRADQLRFHKGVGERPDVFSLAASADALGSGGGAAIGSGIGERQLGRQAAI